MAGFTRPEVLFAGNSYAPERRFYRMLLPGLRERGYTKLVEPYGGSFVVSLIAQDCGWSPSHIEASDVGLFPSILGFYLAGRQPDELGLAVDGEPVDLPGSREEGFARALWIQLQLRMATKPDIAYWNQVKASVDAGADRFTRQLAAHLKHLDDRVGGLTYFPMDGAEHIELVADDPEAVIVAAPPTYTAGFEKFYDTGGRLTWLEPHYQMFDPVAGCEDLMERMADRPALLLLYQEAKTRTGASRNAVFARPGPAGKTAYIRTNRPDDVYQVTGGPRVAPRSAPVLPTKGPWPVLPRTHDITDRSTIEVHAVEGGVAEFYRKLWVHRLATDTTGNNFVVVVDGYAAAAYALGASTMTGFMAMAYQGMLLTYCLAAPHDLRLARLAIMCAKQQDLALRNKIVTESFRLYQSAAVGLITVNFTKYPEAKQMRGLMTLLQRAKHPDGYRLIYTTEWDPPAEAPEVLAEFLTKERRYQKQKGAA